MLEKLQIKNLEKLPDQRVKAIAKLYAQVFALPPWNEAVKCDRCQQFQGLETEPSSLCLCGGTFREAYPLQKTIQYIASESAKPGFRLAIVTTTKNDLAGFAWGWLTTPHQLTVEKWQDVQTQTTIIQTLTDLDIGPNNTIRYLSECGISPQNRGLGLANQLTEQVTGPETTVYRTNCLSPMMAVALTQGFKQIMGPEVIIDRQAKIIIDTGQIIGFLDEQNPQRTLFIKILISKFSTYAYI